MDAYLYSYECKKWWGKVNGLRNIHNNQNLSDEDILDVIKKDASQVSGSKTCDISLLLKYKLAINDINTYTDITKIPFSSGEKNFVNNPFFLQ